MSATPARKLKDLLKERDEVKKQVEDSKEGTTFAKTKVADKEKHIARIVAEAKQDLDVLKSELAGAVLHQRNMESRLEDLENMDYVGLGDFACGPLSNLLTLMRFRVKCWGKSCP
jgi:bifunctional ADP-heptose synthase (sugar kinase/adenylyltransferase)